MEEEGAGQRGQSATLGSSLLSEVALSAELAAGRGDCGSQRPYVTASGTLSGNMGLGTQCLMCPVVHSSIQKTAPTLPLGRNAWHCSGSCMDDPVSASSTV